MQRPELIEKYKALETRCYRLLDKFDEALETPTPVLALVNTKEIRAIMEGARSGYRSLCFPFIGRINYLISGSTMEKNLVIYSSVLNANEFYLNYRELQ